MSLFEMNMGGFSDPKFNEKEEGLEQDVVIPEFVDENVEHINNVNSNLTNSNSRIYYMV